MNIIADLHTHTIASTHAYATVTEMAKAAAEKNLYAIAITDHGRAMPGAPGPFYFESLKVIPQNLFGVRVLKGMEANIIDYEGNIDCSEGLASELEWIVASMHTLTLPEEPSVEKCTYAYLKLAENKNIQVIGHSGTPCFAYDYETVIPVFAKNGKLVEINDSAFRYDRDSKSNCVQIAKLCKKYGARVAVDTDAHFSSLVGEASHTMQMLEEIDFPKELIVNASVETMQSYLKEMHIAL